MNIKQNYKTITQSNIYYCNYMQKIKVKNNHDTWAQCISTCLYNLNFVDP